MMIKVVSFNVRSKNDPDGNSIAERAPRLLKVLENCDADIIGLQEFTPEWETFIGEYCYEKYEVFNRYRGQYSLESVPILWKKNCKHYIELREESL